MTSLSETVFTWKLVYKVMMRYLTMYVIIGNFVIIKLENVTYFSKHVKFTNYLSGSYNKINHR